MREKIWDERKHAIRWSDNKRLDTLFYVSFSAELSRSLVR